MIDKLEITDGEKLTPLWGRLMANWQQELDSLRKQNDNPKNSEFDTAFLRGRIASVKANLALGMDKPVID